MTAQSVAIQGKDTRTDHDRPEQGADSDVQGEDGDEIGDVAPDAHQVPQQPVVEDRNCRPVLVIRMEETAEIARGAPGEELPLVGDEPAPMEVPEQGDEDQCLGRHEHPERSLSFSDGPAVLGDRPGRVVRCPSRLSVESLHLHRSP